MGTLFVCVFYVAAICAAATMADEGLNEKDARIAHLEHELFMVRAMLQEPIARLYGLHPDDLQGPTN